MNKPPQPIPGPTSVPNPAPSPGLTQAAYGPGQPQSLVFAAPSPPQMNSAPQQRQGYYSHHPPMPASTPRVQPGPRPPVPSHVYPTTPQMMIIPQQQLSFAGSPQSYFMPSGQYRPPYMAPTQQYPVTSGTAGFYAGTSPADYSGYAAAYYTAQPPYSASVQPAQVIINSAQQQQPAPPPQQPPAPTQGPPKRERKPIRIRDPNRGGQDITEEIMSGARSATTPTPPQANTTEAGPAQTNGEVIPPVTAATRSDDNLELVGNVETPPPPPPPPATNPEPAFEASQEADNQNAPAAESEPDASDPAPEVATQLAEERPVPSLLPPVTAASSCAEEVEVHADVADSVDAPVCPAPSTAQEEEPPAAPAPCEKAPETQQAEEVHEEEEESSEVKAVEPVGELAEVVAPIDSETQEMPTEMATEAPQSSVSPQEPAASTTPNAEPQPEATPAEPAEPPLSNGLPQDVEELAEEDTTPCDQPDTCQSQESEPVAKTAVPVVEEMELEEKEKEVLLVAAAEEKNKEAVKVAKSEDVPPVAVHSPTEEFTMQAATSVPKKRRNMKEINKKEAIGDLLDAFTEEPDAKPASEPPSTQADPVPVAPAEPPAEVIDETWEEKEDKQNAEPQSSDKKYQDKEEHWKPMNPEDKKRYDRKFLLGFQYNSVSMNKPEGLPVINDVVLDKVIKPSQRPTEPIRTMNVGMDFTPSYLGNLGSRSVGGLRGPPPGPRRSQQGQRKEPRKIITSMSLNDDVQLNKAEKAWKPSTKKSSRGRGEEEPAATTDEELTPAQAQTQEILKRLRSILNKLTPQKFQDLMNQVKELSIDTEERLKGAIDLIFEKAISEPSFSVAYANMCRCLSGLKVPATDKPGFMVTFHKLLVNRCQKEFEKDQDDDVFFEKKQKEMEAAKEEDRERLRLELEEGRDKARRRSLGNIKFIGELFKFKMLTEAIMHDCVVKLLKNHDEESLECLCRLLSTIGKDLDFEKAKPLMDQYFHQMGKIIKEKKTSSRIRFVMQDVLDLRRCNWVPRRGDQGPKTIEQIHKDAEMEEHREQIKVQQQLMSKKDTGGGGGGGGGGRMGGGMGGRGPHTQGGGRGSQPQDEGWNTVPITKRPYDTARLKITKLDNPDLNNQRLAPLGKSWGKGSSGGTGVKTVTGDQDSGRPTTSTVNRFGALQQSSSLSSDSDRRAPQRPSSSRERGGDRERADRDRDRFDRFDRDDRSSRSQITKRSFSRETEERGGRAGENKPTNEPVRRVASMTDSRDRGSRDRGSRDRGSRDRGSRDRGSRDGRSPDIGPSKDLPAKHESAPAPSLPKPALTEEELEKKSTAIIEEYLNINDLTEALQCVSELNSSALLYVFVRQGVEATLERSSSAREHMGTLLHKLTSSGTMPVAQYFKGLLEILEIAEDMAIDIPHIWLYLAEIITPMLLEGGIPMGQLFGEIAKPLLPLGKADVLLVQILHSLCKGMTRGKVGSLWKEAGLNWSDFLAKDEDVDKFVTEQKVEFTTGKAQESKESTKNLLSGDALRQELDRLLRDKASDQRIKDWVEANLDKQQSSSNHFARALMTAVCQLAIIGDPYKVDVPLIHNRAVLLQGFLSDEQKELQALYALQALMVQMEQPANLLRMFFDTLYDADVIKEDAFYKWESSKDAAEQNGKGVALKSATAFFSWLREPDPEEQLDKD